MARGQDPARRGGAGGSLSRIAVLVHDRIEAEAAHRLTAEANREVELVSPAGFAGVAFVKALEELVGQPITADCGDSAGLVMAGIRIGLRRLVFTGSAATRERLASMAAVVGAEVLDHAPLPLHRVRGDGLALLPLGPDAPAV